MLHEQDFFMKQHAPQATIFPEAWEKIASSKTYENDDCFYYF
jgi:hypothetical protein